MVTGTLLPFPMQFRLKITKNGGEVQSYAYYRRRYRLHQCKSTQCGKSALCPADYLSQSRFDRYRFDFERGRRARIRNSSTSNVAYSLYLHLNYLHVHPVLQSSCISFRIYSRAYCVTFKGVLPNIHGRTMGLKFSFQVALGKLPSGPK